MRVARRGALAAIGALAASGCVTSALPRRARPVGLADITVRKELAADYAGTLRRLADIGYTHFGFRLAPMSPREPVEPSAADKAAMVGDAGLAIDTVRLGFSAPVPGQMEAAAAMGAKTMAYTAAPIFFRGSTLGETTREAFDAWLPELDEIAELARANGLRLAYHNHWWDHVPLDGESPLDIIAKTYSPREVGFEIDVAWAYLGGQDPVELVKAFGARVLALHLKDVDPTRGQDMQAQLVAPGAGILDFPRLMPRLDALTSAIGYVEIDAPEDGIAAARQGFNVITNARGA